MQKLFGGKVRDVYDAKSDTLLLVSSDRVSAFDVVLPKEVLDKGKILNAMALWWFNFTKEIIPNHIVSASLKDFPVRYQKKEWEGRAVLVKKLKMIPFEFIVRGYCFGHLWAEQKEGSGYQLAEKLQKPLLSVSTKAHSGHDEYIEIATAREAIGSDLFDKIQTACYALYEAAYAHAYANGIIIADTKLEFGCDTHGNLYVADEIFTPDSSRFWDVAEYQVGVSPKSYDKQVLRDWLSANTMRIHEVPDSVLQQTADIYKAVYKKLCSSEEIL